MIKTLPDKWIRKAISEALQGLKVDNLDIPVFDYFVTGECNPHHYILIESQSNDVDRGNKCEDLWESEVLIIVITQYFLPGNPGSRLLADNIMDKVREKLQGLQLDPGSGLKIIDQSETFPADITTTLDNVNVFQKNITLNLKIQ